MDLKEIKQGNDSVWLYILKQHTVFDVDSIKAQKEWLIKSAEIHQEAIKLALMTLEDNDLMNDNYWKIQQMLDEI